jgi:hypothetical protein
MHQHEPLTADTLVAIPLSGTSMVKLMLTMGSYETLCYVSVVRIIILSMICFSYVLVIHAFLDDTWS